MLTQLTSRLWYVEPILYAFMLIAFWLPSPIRDPWLRLLFLLPLFWGARWLSCRRLWPNTPLQWLLLVFLVLGVLNIWFAPYTRGILILGRPLMGIALYFYFVEYAYRYQSTKWLLAVTTLLSLLLGIIAVLTTQWNTKSNQMSFIIDALPNITTIPGIEGGFNANEIAGAISWLLPVMAALAAYRWRDQLPRVGVTGAFLLLFMALFLGQSRLAVIGMLVALALVVYVLLPAGRWRNAGLLALIVTGVFEILIITNAFNVGSQRRTRVRDEFSFTSRVDIWRSGLAIIQDYPLTGAGMNMYRSSPLRQLYPVKRYENRVLPHAHNEWVQIGSDLGVPGLIVFTAWFGVAGYMLLITYRHGTAELRALAVGVAAGLLAHAVFASGDANPLWDRFAFVFWWLLALAGAGYITTQKSIQAISPDECYNSSNVLETADRPPIADDSA